MIPVFIVSGFLGSGKTTLINRFLQLYPQTRVGILTNELGTHDNYEAHNFLIEEFRVDQLRTHCISCLPANELHQKLSRLLKRVKPTLLFIEASGLSHPATLIQLLQSNTLQNRIQVLAVINVIDSLNWQGYRKQFCEVEEQLRFSSLTYLSKSHLISSEKLNSLIQEIQAVKSSQPIFRSVEQIPWKLLLESRAPLNLEFTRSESHDHSHLNYLEYSLHQPLDPHKLGLYLKNLNPKILRIKGQLYLKHPSSQFSRYILNHAFALSLLSVRSWPWLQKKQTRLLVIGQELNSTQIKEELNLLVG